MSRRARAACGVAVRLDTSSKLPPAQQTGRLGKCQAPGQHPARLACTSLYLPGLVCRMEIGAIIVHMTTADSKPVLITGELR